MCRKVFLIAAALGIGFLLVASAGPLPNSKAHLFDGEQAIRLPYRGSSHLDENDIQYRYVKTTDYGHTWSEIRQAGDLSDLAAWNGEMYNFGSLCDDQNNLHFMGVLNGFANAANNGVYDVHTTDGGTTWVRSLIAAQGSNTYEWASAAKDPSGNLYCLIWGTNASNQTTFWASKSTNHGSTWSTPVVVATEPTIHYTAEYPHLAENASANYFFFIFQDANQHFNQYCGRFPTSMAGPVQIVNLNAYSGTEYSYYIGACGPIDYDPTNNALYLCFRNQNVSGTAVYYSGDEGVTFSGATISGAQRYPSMALNPYSQTPWVFSNFGVPASGTYHKNWYAYDELGFNGGAWTSQIPHDSLLYDGTRELLYVHQGYFADANNVINMCNVWGQFTPEALWVNYSTNGGTTWHGGWKVWDVFDDGLVAGFIEQCQLDGGTNGVAYITFCARYGQTDFDGPVISNQMLVTPATELPPYVVSADYWDATGVDYESGYIWVNWICYSHGAEWNWANPDDYEWSDPETFSGTYFFTIPATHYDGDSVSDGDTIWFYCDGYDVLGNYSFHPLQYVIAGHEWGPQYPNAGYVTLISPPGPPDWGYRLNWVSGAITRLIFTNFCSGTIGAVGGNAEIMGWTVSNYADSIVFAAGAPLTSGTLDTFWLSHPYCSDVVAWTAGDSSGTVEGPLPVELTTFEALGGDGQVTLHWRTESELDNDHFVLYKRKAGDETFGVLTQVSGRGTTTEPHDYEFVDRWVQNGITYEYRISDVDMTGRETVHEQIASATPTQHAIPHEFALYPNWPNPFNPTTTIRYDVKETGLVTLKVFDLLGRKVATLVNDEISAGSHAVIWDADDSPSGVYLCRMEAKGFAQTRKLLLVK
ncbi:MAG: T9SS type A sorting domain-containing protein [bacterium]